MRIIYVAEIVILAEAHNILLLFHVKSILEQLGMGIDSV